MKKLILFSSALFMTFSCQNESITGTTDPISEVKALPAVKEPQSLEFGITKSVVLAESNKIGRLNVVYPALPNQSSYYGVSYGSTRLILDLQADGNLIFKAVRLNSNGSVAGWKDLWTSNTGGREFNGNRSLIAQADGNLVLYNNGDNMTGDYWNAQTYQGQGIQNPVIKVQFIKETSAINTGAPTYYGIVMLEGNGQDRKVIAKGEFKI